MTAQFLAIMFGATFVQSAFGFGEALIAVPLLAFIMPMTLIAPFIVLVSVTVAGVIAIRDWRHIEFRRLGRLLAATLIGTPLGLIALKALPEHVVTLTLSVIIIAFSICGLMMRTTIKLHGNRWEWLVGVCSGVLGSAYGMSGPPLVMYGVLQGWSPQRFRATLQGYFFPAGFFVMAGYLITGIWTTAIAKDYAMSLPVVLAAVLIGRVVNRQLKGETFHTYIYAGLMGIGILLMIRTLR